MTSNADWRELFQLKNVIKVLIIVVLAYAIGRFVVVFKDSRLAGERAPYIQMVTNEGVIIRWLSESNELGVVRYGEDSSHLSEIELENSLKSDHTIILKNLKPATRYYYQTGKISSSHHFSPEKHWFYTRSEEIVPTRIWAIGDPGKVGETLNQVRDSALDWMRSNPLLSKDPKQHSKPLIDIWLALGDIAYRSGTNEQFQSALFEPFEGLMSNTVLWPIYGNHDDRRWTYFRIFDLPQNAEAGGIASHTENYYSLDYSNVHMVILDSQASDRSVDGDMAKWLEADLANNKKTWLIAAFHHPPYSKGSHDSDDESDSGGRMHEMRENIMPILEKAGVDIVLAGHSHMYERSYLIDCAYQESENFSDENIVSKGVEGNHKRYQKPEQQAANQGAIYIVAGSSSKVDNGDMDHPAHTVGMMEAGSVIIDVDGNKLISRFINNKGDVMDEFSITKESGYISGYSGCI